MGHKALNMLLSCGQRSPFWIESLVSIGINIALLQVFKISQWTLTIIQFAQQLLTDPYGVAESIFPLLNKMNICQLCYQHTSAPLRVNMGSDVQVHPRISGRMEN